MKDTIVTTREYGDFVLRLQYVNSTPNEISSDYQPAIVIARPKRSQSRSAWVIMLSSAFKYVDDPKRGGHSMYMQVASQQICRMLGMSETKEKAFEVSEAILSNLVDLINMPPVNFEDDPIADISVDIDGTHIEATLH